MKNIFKQSRFTLAHTLTKALTNNYGGSYKANFSLILKELYKVTGEEYVEFVQLVLAPKEEVKEEVQEQWDGLTVMETEFMKALVTNDYSNALEEYTNYPKASLYHWGEWYFAIEDVCSFSSKQAKGVFSSLIKKGYLTSKGKGTETTVNLTLTGYQLLKANYKA